MQSPRANKGMFSRVSQGLGFGRPSKRLQRDSVPAVDSSGVRRPPVGGGSHMDEEDRFPAAQRDQPAHVQEGTEGFKASSSQPATSMTNQPASSDFSEIQPASNSEDASGQTVFAAPYKNTAISKLMSETKGPSTTIPPSEPTRTLSQQSQQPQATIAGPEPTVSQTAPTTERLQTVPGCDSRSSGQGQNMSTGGFRSSSVPSEDEVSQLYPNEGEGGQDVGGDLPEDMQIGYSGKGGGIFGSFGAPARSARPTPQADMAGQAHDSPPSMLQLPDSAELRSQHQPEGRALREAAPGSSSPPQSTAGQHATPMPQGELPTYRGAQPENRSEAVQTPESAASGKFMTPPESPESFPYEPTQESRVPFQADTRPQHHDSIPQQYVTPTPEQAQHDVPHLAGHAAASTEKPVDDSGSYAGGPESAQGTHSQSQVAPSGEGMPLSAEGQQQREVIPTESYQSHQGQQEVKSGGQGTAALAEGGEQYPATPDRFNRAPQPASPEDMPVMGAATQGSKQHMPPQPVPEEGPMMGGNSGVADIPNYPRENPLFDEDQPQPQQGVAEEPAVQQPVFHDNPAYDEKKTRGQAALGSPMIPNRSSTHTPSQQGTYEASPQVSERQAQPRTSLDIIDIPPEFDPSSISGQQGQSGMPRQLTAPGQHPSQTLASGPPAVTPQSVNTAAGGEAAPGVVSSQPEAYSESRDVPHEERGTAAPVTAQPQVYENSTFEQEGQRREQPYGEAGMLSGQREHPSEAVTAANAAVEEEVMNRRQPQVETETVSNAAEDGRAPVQQPFEQQQHAVPEAHTGPTQEGAAEAFAVQPAEASQETIVDKPAVGEHSTSQLASGSEFKGYSQAETTPVDTRSMLVQEGDPPMGRPVILSKEATLLAQPPSAAWGSAGSTGFDSSTQPSASAAPLPASSAPVDEPAQVGQSPVVAEAAAPEPVMMDQDPPIDPSVETAPPREPALPVSTMTGQASAGHVTNTPQLDSAAPGLTQELTPAADQPVAATSHEVLSNQPAQMDTSEDAAAPMAAPRPPPMTTEQIAAYRSGADPDFDPVERRGWWEVDLTSGGGTILPSNTRGPRRGTGRGESRLTAPAMTGAHIHPGGDPSQATHFGSIVSGGSRRQQGAEARSGGQVRGQVGGAPGVYFTPPLAGQAQPAQGVATPGEGEARPAGRSAMTTQDVAAYRPAQDPRYDPTEGRPGASALPTALPAAGNAQIENPLFEEQQQHQDISSTAFDQVETLPGQKDVTHRGEQVGTPTFAPQQGSSTFGAAPLHPPQGRSRTRTPTQRGTTEEYSSRPILGSGGRRARTTKLSDIGRPAQAPPAPKPFVPLPVQPRAEYEMGGADMLPQDSHHVKPTPYGELGAHARSALSGAGWKTTWAMEMEDTQQQQALKYPVGPVEPKGASGFGPKAAPDTVGEPDYAALARGEPGLPTGSHMGPDMPSDSGALTNLPPSVTGATSGLGEEVGGQPSYMQMAPPPVHPGAPVTDRGFTGPGGAAGGARRRLAGKLFERQHSLQDPSFDPVSQRFGADEGYGVELPAHKPANIPSGNMAGRGSTGFGSEQGGMGGGGPSQGMRASSVASGVRSPTPTPTAPHSGQEQLGYAEGMGQEGIRLGSGEGTAPQGAVQGGVAEPADRSREVNERLLMEVRRRLQEARSQLHTGADGAPSEVDAGTPVDSPLGGRPKVLQGQGSSGTPGQYWRTLEEVEAEGNNPVSRDAPSPWVQTRGADMAPRKLFQASSSMMAGTRSHIVPSGRTQHQGLNNHSAGRVHNIGGGYPHRRPRGGNTYSWGRAGVF